MLRLHLLTALALVGAGIYHDFGLGPALTISGGLMLIYLLGEFLFSYLKPEWEKQKEEQERQELILVKLMDTAHQLRKPPMSRQERQAGRLRGQIGFIRRWKESLEGKIRSGKGEPGEVESLPEFDAAIAEVERQLAEVEQEET